MSKEKQKDIIYMTFADYSRRDVPIAINMYILSFFFVLIFTPNGSFFFPRGKAREREKIGQIGSLVDRRCVQGRTKKPGKSG